MDETRLKDPDQAVVLNYIDKVYASLGRAWILENRLTLVTLILSLLLLIISAGVVSPQERFSFGGLELAASLAGFLAGGIVIVTSLVIFFYSLAVRTVALQNEIRRLYATINYRRERNAMVDALTSPFQGENAIAMLLGPLLSERIRPKNKMIEHYDRIVALSILFLIILLPMAAEAAALLKLAAIVGWERYWLWLPLILFILATITAPAVYLFSGRGE